MAFTLRPAFAFILLRKDISSIGASIVVLSYKKEVKKDLHFKIIYKTNT
jgi:hypothetical protein